MSDQFKKASILKDANTSYSISTQKMSEQVKRYVPVDRHGVSALMQEDAELGGWVRGESYDLLSLEHATLQAEYRRVRDNQNTLIARVRRIENELAALKAQEPIAWLVDWPDEPELGHYFAEEPNDTARSRPLYTLPTVNQQMTVAE